MHPAELLGEDWYIFEDGSIDPVVETKSPTELDSGIQQPVQR